MHGRLMPAAILADFAAARQKYLMRAEPNHRISGPAFMMTSAFRRSGRAIAKAGELIAPSDVIR